MKIRQETERDFEQIYDFVRIAFQTAKVSDGSEQDFVNKLRGSCNYIPELALVAEECGQLMGHIMLTKTYVSTALGCFEALLLAPVAIALEYRNKGRGTKLITESFQLAKNMGYTAVFLVGDPGYYQRFGFKPAVQFGIKSDYNLPDEYVLACELTPQALKGFSGTVHIIS